MIPYIGDFAEDATVYHYFNTFDSNDPSASVTATDLVDADIFVYKDGSVTDIVTDGATVVIDFDSRTGIHKITIDTSVHADYAVGSDYMVSVIGVTVDAGTINAAVFTFSIENRTTFPKADYPTNFTSMGIEADGHVHGDVKEWLGTAVTSGTGGPDVNVNAISDDLQAAIDFETMLDGTGGNALSLGQLNIVASGNDTALVATGAGTGAGFIATAGSSSNNHGIRGEGKGTGHGIYGLSAATGDGIRATANSGDGFTAYSGSGNGFAIDASGGSAWAIASPNPYLDVNVFHISGSATAANNAEVVFDTDFATNYNATRNAWATNAQDFVGTTAADPFNGQVVAASVTGAVGSVTGAVASVTGAVGSVTGNVGGNVTGSVGSNLELGPTEVNAQVVDVLNTDSFAEPTGVPAASATLATKIGYLYMALRNKVTVTATKKTFFDDGDAAEWEKDLSDDGTTYTETEGNAI